MNRRKRKPSTWKRLRATVRSYAARMAPEPEEAPEILEISTVRLSVIVWLGRASLLASVLAFAGMLYSMFDLTRQPSPVLAAIPSSTATPATTRVPTLTPSPKLPLVALLAGHSGGIDPGANCPDGLKEVDVTTDVASRAKTILEARGYRVDVLKEFDSKLSATRRDYSPRVFLAIHADSCIYYASGYKVARADYSASPNEDDRLVRCVTADYAAATQLPFHSGSITADMTEYHALNEIDPKTPAAIIELGFLGSEHTLLKSKRDLVASGVANGVDNFMRGDQCSLPVVKQ